MKKLTALCLLILLLVALCGCGASGSGDAAGLEGTYYCTSMSIPGLSMNPMEMGIEIQLRLSDDGTGTLAFVTGGVDYPLTWHADGDTLTMSVDNYSACTADRTDDSLTLHLTDETGTQDMVFVKH